MNPRQTPQADQELFARLLQQLFEAALGPGVTRRDLTLDDVTNVSSLIGALLMFEPGTFEGVHLIDDSDTVLETLKVIATEAGQPSDS